MSDIIHKNIYLLIKEYNSVIYELLNLLKVFIDKYNELRVLYGYEKIFMSIEKNIYIISTDSISVQDLSENIFKFKQNLIKFIIFFCNKTQSDFLTTFNSIIYNPLNNSDNYYINNILNIIYFLKKEDFKLYDNQKTSIKKKKELKKKYEKIVDIDDATLRTKFLQNIKDIKDEDKIKKTLKDFDIDIDKGDDFINELISLKNELKKNSYPNKTIHLIYIQDLLLKKLFNFLIKKKKINDNYINFLFNINNSLNTISNKNDIKKLSINFKKIFSKIKLDDFQQIINGYFDPPETNLEAINVKHSTYTTSIKSLMDNNKENIEYLIEIFNILLLRDKTELENYKTELEKSPLKKDLLEKVNKELELIDIDDVADFLIKLIELDLYIYYDDKKKIYFKDIKIKQISKENIKKIKENLKVFKNDNLLFDGEELKEEFKILLSQ